MQEARVLVLSCPSGEPLALSKLTDGNMVVWRPDAEAWLPGQMQLPVEGSWHAVEVDTESGGCCKCSLVSPSS